MARNNGATCVVSIEEAMTTELLLLVMGFAALAVLAVVCAIGLVAIVVGGMIAAKRNAMWKEFRERHVKDDQ